MDDDNNRPLTEDVRLGNPEFSGVNDMSVAIKNFATAYEFGIAVIADF